MRVSIQDTELFKFFQKHEDICLKVLVGALSRTSASYDRLNNAVLFEHKINCIHLFNGDYRTSLTSTSPDIVKFFNTPVRDSINVIRGIFKRAKYPSNLGLFFVPFQSLDKDFPSILNDYSDLFIGYDEYSLNGELRTFTDFISYVYIRHAISEVENLRDFLLDVEYFVRLQGFYPNIGRDIAVNFIKSFCEALPTDVDKEMFRSAFYSDRQDGYWKELFNDVNPFIFDLFEEYLQLVCQRKEKGLEVKIFKVEREDKEGLESSKNMNEKEGDNMENLNGLRSVNNRENENNEGANSTPSDEAKRTFERNYLGIHPEGETETKTEKESDSSFWKNAGIIAGSVLAGAAAVVIGKSIWNKITSDSKPMTDNAEMFEEA